MSKNTRKPKSTRKPSSRRTERTSAEVKEDARSKNPRSHKSYDRDLDNAAEWYTRNTALVADSGKIPFTWPAGVPVDLEYSAEAVPGSTPFEGDVTINGLAGTKFITPGVMALKYVPTYGCRFDGYDPLNIASQNIYTYVRHVNSGHANYDPNDLMMYLLAMDQVYTLWMHLVRAYGSIRLFSQVNRNYPRVLMNAMGFDYDDVSRNLANFRYYINNAATRIGALVVPDIMPLYARHKWMPSFVFSDSPSMKGQLYLFRPVAFGQYNEKTSEEGGFLEVKWMNHVHTVQEWMELLDSMIGAVRASEDCGIMSGDILKAYGDKVCKLMPISEDFMTNVGYSEEVLGQIANATICRHPAYEVVPGAQHGETMMLYQDIDNNIVRSGLQFNWHNPTASVADFNARMAALYTAKRVMIGLTESPAPDEVLVSSRLMVFMKLSSAASGAIIAKPDSCGTEIIVDAAMFDTQNLEGLASSANPAMKPERYCSFAMLKDNSAITSTTNYFNVMRRMNANLNFFNLHPQVWTGYTYLADSKEHIELDVEFDVDNYAIVNAHDIYKMHETSLLSMLDVPLLGINK